MTNLLPLDIWRQHIGYNPFHFWGLKNTTIPVLSACNNLVTEYAWQNSDAISRQAIRRAIATAESRLREHLNFSVGRRFLVETTRYPRPFASGYQYAASVGSDGRWLNVRLSEGMIRNIGAETRTTIDLAAAVTLSDADGDGVNETFTVTVNTTVTDPDEIAVYFGASDRLDGEAVSERWRVLPVKVSISGGVATIKGRAWLLVKPILYEGVNAKAGLSPDTAGNFVSTVAVYRYFCSPAGTTTDDAQATLVWETEPYPAWATGCLGTGLTFEDNSSDPAAIAYAVGRVGIRDARLGEVTIGRANYDSADAVWAAVDWATCRQPDRVIIRYEAGARYEAMESTMSQIGADGRWDEVVSRLACAELPRRDFGCDEANAEIYRWQFDLARAGGAASEQYRISDRDLSNPFGTAAGAVYAWKQVSNLQLTQAFVAV
jgi:hypothetical protein